VVALGSQHGSSQSSSILSLLTNSTARTDGLKAGSLAMELASDASGSQALTFLANPWFGASAPGNLYAGTETIGLGAATGNTSTVLTAPLTRGRFGSLAQSHIGVVREGNKSSGGALYVAEYPLTMVGRIATLWCCPGDFVKRDGGATGWSFNPAAQTLEGTENKILYAGLVDGVNEDGTIVTFRTSSLDQCIKNSPLKSAPRCQLGNGGLLRSGLYYIGDHNKWVHFELEIAGETQNPYIVIPAIANVTPGDTIQISATVLTAVAGAPAAGQFQIGASENATYTNIAAAINASALFGTVCTAYNRGTGVDLVPYIGILGTPNSAITITTTNANAITCTSSVTDPQNGTTTPIPFRTVLNQQLRRSQLSDGLPTFEDVPEGTYTAQQLAAYLTDTMNEQLPYPLRVSVRLAMIPHYDQDNSVYTGILYDLIVSIQPTRQGMNARLIFFTQRDDNECFLRDMGFTDLELELKKVSDGTEEFTHGSTANRPPAIFRMPPYPRRIPARIYIDYIDPWSSTWLTAAGWTEDDATAILPHLLLKDVGVISFNSYSSGNLPFISSILRSPLSSPNTEEIYIEYDEADPKTLEAERVVALPNVSANRMMLYMLLSGSGDATNHADYDEGWPGCGLLIPSDVVDVTSFETLDASNPQPREGWVILQSDDARKIFDEELKATQQQIVADLGVLKLISMDPPLEALDSTVHTIDETVLVSDSEKGVGFDRQENRIVNIVRVRGDWDARENKFWFDQTNRQQDSIGTWGEQQPISIDLRGLRLGDSDARGKALAERIFGLYSQPYALVEVDVAPLASWLWEVGDFVDLTHPNIPHTSKGTRGVTDLRCRIVQKQARYAGGDKAFCTVTLQSYAFQGRRTSLWGPSCQLVYAGVANTWTRVADAYGAQINGMDDEDYFSVSDSVRLMRMGNSSTILSKTIATKVGADFTFNTALAGSANQKYIMWYAPYDDASLVAAQRKYAYFSAYDGKLDRSGGTTDAAFRWV
jgi:hypothetical protein